MYEKMKKLKNGKGSLKNREKTLFNMQEIIDISFTKSFKQYDKDVTKMYNTSITELAFIC
ncbi:MAG: hypothetical protein IJF53_01910 [Clostridia bacterium]|nr:hypothetical protein [Clostridia bacterium]